MSDLPPEPSSELPETPTSPPEAVPQKRRRSKVITRPARILIEIIFAVVFLIAIAAGGLMWRLSYGPISLENILPVLQSELNDMSPGLTYTIDKASLEPGNRWRAFNVRLYGITVGNQDKKTIGSLEEMVLGFSWRNFFNLTFIPSIIEIQRPTVQITRFSDGHIGFNLQATNEGQPQAPMPELAQLMAHTLGALREIQVVDAFVHYHDLKDPFSFDAKNGTFSLKRERNAISGTLALDVKAEKFEQKIRGTIVFDPEKEETHFTVDLKDLPPDQLADFLPQIPSEIKLKMPADITLVATIDKSLMPVGVDMQVIGKIGTLIYPPYYPEPIKLADVLLNAHYDLVDHSFEISDLSAMLDKAKLHAQASLTHDKDPQQPSKLEVLGLLEGFPVNNLQSYWPQGLAMNARTWIVDHLHEGIVDRAGLNMQATIDKDNKFTLGSVGGKINFHGMTVNYLPPMRPVENVVAEAQYDLNSFSIAVEKGDVLKTQVTKADILIDDFDKPDQKITLDIDTKGPAEDVITIISAKPLEYPQKLGFNASQFSGNAEAKVHLQFPLLNDLKLDQVQMHTTADLTDISVKNAVKDLTVSGKDLKIDVDTEKLSLEGDAKLADADAKVTWNELFGDKVPYTTMITVDGAVTPAVLKGLRLPLEKYFKGSATAKVALKQDQKKTTFVTVDAGLKNAGITLSELHVEKKDNIDGKLYLEVTALRGGPSTISKVNASWPDFALKDGTIRWNAQDDMDMASLKGMTVGRSKVDIDIAPAGDNAVKATLRGDVIDLSGYWATPNDPNDKSPPDPRRYDLSMNARTLFLDPEVPLRNVNANVSIQQKNIITANITASTDQNGTLNMQQVVLPTGGRKLTIKATNAGRVFQALDTTDSVTNGTFLVSGQSKKETPSVIEGHGELRDFMVIKAPVLARMINAFSLSGLLELLNSRGLVFSKMATDFSLEKQQVVRLKDGRMTGASMGMSFNGRIYRDTQTMDMTGTIVPVEGLNKMVSKIPLIGQILTGLKGEGLIAATYTVKGKTDNPTVSVNPLSVLTPGILRSILFEDNSN